MSFEEVARTNGEAAMPTLSPANTAAFYAVRLEVDVVVPAEHLAAVQSLGEGFIKTAALLANEPPQQAGLWVTPLGPDGKRPDSTEISPYARADYLFKALGITARELQVLDLIAAGHTNSQVAEELGLRTPTIKSHLNRIAARLATGRRAAMVDIVHRAEERMRAGLPPTAI